MHKAKEKGHRAHGQNKIMHAYGPKSTPIAQGLVTDINAKHAYGPSSAPIAQGLVYDINAPHAFGLRESKRTYWSVSLLPNEEGVSTLAPHTLLKAASKHAAKLKENRMLYNVSDAIKAQISGLLDSRDRRVSLRGLERDSSRRHKLCVPCLPRARPKQCSLPLIPFLEGHS